MSFTGSEVENQTLRSSRGMRSEAGIKKPLIKKQSKWDEAARDWGLLFLSNEKDQRRHTRKIRQRELAKKKKEGKREMIVADRGE